MAKFYNISDWFQKLSEKPHKGSRPNHVYEKIDSEEQYFFKLSKETYPSEIWSEVITSKIGQAIGFDILDYNIAWHEPTQKLGCLSKNMVNKELNQVLYHGIDILKDNIPQLDITNPNKPIYTFQDLEQICKAQTDYNAFLLNFLEMIVFDTIIGNTDRHTENWAFIQQNNDYVHSYSFAPVYDSGSCLGREFTEEKVTQMLDNESFIQKYIRNCKSEIRWHNTKLNLFELVANIYTQYPSLTQMIMEKVVKILPNKQIEAIVVNIDANVIPYVTETFLTPNRKKLITKLLEKRIENLLKSLSL